MSSRIITSNGVLEHTALEREIDTHYTWIMQHQVGRIGLHMDNGVDWIAWDLAASKARITCIPLPTFFSAEQLAHCTATAEIDAVVANGVASINADHRSRPMQAADGSLIAKITFTSGSTGNPKGVLLTQHAIDQVVDALADGLAHVDTGTHLCLVPLSILLENIAGIYLPLQRGLDIAVPATASLGIIGSSGIHRGKLAAAINHYKPGSLVLFPQLLLALVELAEQQMISCEPFRFLAVGGAKVSPDLIRRARQAGLPVYEGYGLSECGSVVALNLPGKDRAGSVGRVLPHQVVSIEDGEIIVEGSSFSGYLESTGITSSVGRVATGDEGCLDADGFLYIQGRRKHVLVNSFGRNINPEWPESRLMESPLIHQAVVTGEAKPFLAAIVVTNEQNLDPIQKHIEAINDSLPDYARIGRWFAVAPSLLQENRLVTANGRIKRKSFEEFFKNDIDKLYEVSP